MPTENQDFFQIAAEADIGHLGIMTPDGYPRVVPVNFVAIGQTIYFHGATSGEKFQAFRDRPQVTFSIDIPCSMIPSYWRSEKYACPATQYFKSALVKGRGFIVEDPTEKALVLQALMEKHQPEGGFDKIGFTDPMYRKPIDEVAIFRIDPNQIDTRIKFGQNLTEKTRAVIIEKLKERGRPMDLRTAAAMEQPFEGESTDQETA